VTSSQIDRGSLTFMEAVIGGHSLRTAIAAALHVDDQFDVRIMLRDLLGPGLVVDFGAPPIPPA
jgi:hypothetical protein